MRTVLLVMGMLAALLASGQTFKIDYDKEIRNGKPPLKRTFSYNTGGRKDAVLVVSNVKKETSQLQFFIDNAATPVTDEAVIKRDTKKGEIEVKLDQWQDEGDHRLIVKLQNGKKEVQVADLKLEPGNEVSGGDDGGRKGSEGEEEEGPRVDFWVPVKENGISINLKRFYLTGKGCCDTCTGCESAALQLNDRIIYDALTGNTYFQPATKNAARFCSVCVPDTNNKRKKDSNPLSCFKVNNQHVIKLRANDAYLFQVINVNPDLYDVELTDTSFLFFNESTAMLENSLLGKAEGFKTEARKGEEPDNNEEYLRVRAGLVLLNAEMAGLLENLRVSNRFFNNCITASKQKALPVIDSFIVTTLGKGKFDTISFRGFVDLFLDPASPLDSALSRQLKENYRQFQLSKYELVYRLPRAPAHDQVNFTLKILRKENSPYPNLLNPKQPTQVAYVRNFFKVDVSSGLYYTEFKNQTYSIRADSVKVPEPGGSMRDSTGNRLVEERTGKGEIGFASFLHFYYKLGINVNLGALLGAGISFEETPQPRYFTGFSLMIGRSNRLCINSGWVWGNQQRLSDQYTKKTDGSYHWLPAEETTPKYIKRFQARGFISLSYNLPFLKRKTPEVKAKEGKKD